MDDSLVLDIPKQISMYFFVDILFLNFIYLFLSILFLSNFYTRCETQNYNPKIKSYMVY